ncbi:hypothetical protein J1605_003781 [Eschrichtius robustus]|uniref:Uncharacterized protein n=1 Tax=Eschrichtius robustus TaxID=9764 RepID=A0AB34HNI5_ESCRO|nr:hypothetical protein J1605_003781 [Eschrichtius robustus]
MVPCTGDGTPERPPVEHLAPGSRAARGAEGTACHAGLAHTGVLPTHRSPGPRGRLDPDPLVREQHPAATKESVASAASVGAGTVFLSTANSLRLAESRGHVSRLPMQGQDAEAEKASPVCRRPKWSALPATPSGTDAMSTLRDHSLGFVGHVQHEEPPSPGSGTPPWSLHLHSDSALPSSLSGHCLAQVLPHDRAHMSWLSGSGPHVTTRRKNPRSSPKIVIFQEMIKAAYDTQKPPLQAGEWKEQNKTRQPGSVSSRTALHTSLILGVQFLGSPQGAAIVSPMTWAGAQGHGPHSGAGNQEPGSRQQALSGEYWEGGIGGWSWPPKLGYVKGVAGVHDLGETVQRTREMGDVQNMAPPEQPANRSEPFLPPHCDLSCSLCSWAPVNTLIFPPLHPTPSSIPSREHTSHYDFRGQKNEFVMKPTHCLGRCLKGLRVQRHSCWCDSCGVTTAHHLAAWDAAKARLDEVAAANNGDEGAGIIIPPAPSFTAHPVHTPG